jgi:hypothetical protein
MFAETKELNRWKKLKTKVKLTVADVNSLKSVKRLVYPHFMTEGFAVF